MDYQLSPASLAYPQDFTGFATSILRGEKGRILKDGTFVNHYGPILGWQRYPLHQANFILGLTQLWSMSESDKIEKLIVKESTNLVERSRVNEENDIGFPTSFQILGYRLPPVWYSSLTQSHAASAFCRVGIIVDDEFWEENARRAMRFVMHSRELCTADLDSGGYWYEEYPCDPPAPVLNGHLYTLIGFLDSGNTAYGTRIFGLLR